MRKNMYGSSLRFRLFLLTFLAAVLAIAVVLLAFAIEKHSATAKAQWEAQQIARLTSHDYEQVASDTRLLLGMLAQLQEVRNSDVSSMNKVFADLMGQSSIYANIVAFDPQGNMFASGLPFTDPVNVSDRAYFKHVLADRRFTTSEYLIGRVSGKASVGFAYPVLGNSANILSVLYVGIDLQQLNQVVLNADLPPGSTLTLVDRDGLVLVRHPEPEKWVGKSMPEAPVVDAVLTQKEGSAKATGLDGLPRFYGFVPLKASGEDGAYIIVGIPEDVALGQVHQALQRNLALLAVLFVLLLALVWLGSERLFLRPVRSLLGATRRMASGDLGARTGVSSVRTGELSELAHAFDDMAESLQARQAETQRLTRMLTVLSEVNQTIVRTADLKEMYHHVCRIAVEFGGFRLAWAGLVEDGGLDVKPVAWFGQDESQMDRMRIPMAGPGTHAGPIGAAIQDGRSFICNDAREDASPIWAHENVLKQHCRSFAAFPLRVGTRTAGAIFFYSAETAFFNGEEVRLLTELAGDVSFAMESADRETRRRQEEERARELREYLQLQVDRMPIALITWDEQFRVGSWNPAAESMFGYPREEALGKHAYELIVPKEVQPHVDDVWRRLLEGDSTAHSVNENITKGGRTVVCQWANTPLKKDDGEVVGVLSMVQDITEQKAAESRVQRRLEFEHVVASISARFVAPADMNAAVNLSLADIGALSAADRAYLFLLRQGGTVMDNTHEWCAKGVSPQIDNLKGLPSETFPWWMSKLRNGEVIHITDVSRLPPEAKAERDILECQETKSLIVLPVHASGELAGFVGLDNVRHAGYWNEADLAVLRVTSQIIGNAIGRSRAEQGLKDREERLRALYDVGRGLAGSLSTRLLSQLALGEALKVATLDAGIIRYLDNATDELILVTTSGLPDELEATMRRTAGRVKLGHGFAGEAAQTGRAIVVEEVEGDGRCLVPDLVKFGFHSATYLPLKAKDRVVGVISGYSKMKRTFEQQDMEVLTALGTMVGMAMANARLFEQTESAKREWEQTFDSMSEGVAIISPERRIMRANLALARMLGSTSVDELVGKHCHDMVHGLDKPPQNCPTCACMLTKLSCEAVWQEPHLGGRWLSMKGDPILDANGEVAQIVHTFADVTEQKKRQKAMERLHDMSRALSSTLELHEAMRLAVREVRDIFGGAGSTIGIALLDDWRQRLDIAAALGPRQGDWEGISLPLDQLSPEGVHTLLQERRPWLQSDLTQSSEAARRLPGFLGHRSLIALPLVSGDQAIGVVFLARAEAELPAEDEVALLETCSGEIARAIHNAQLFTRTDSALRRRIAEQEALTGVLGAATKSLDLDSVLKDALKRAAEALDVDAAGIALADETGQRLTVQSAYERKSDSYRAVGVDLDLSKLPSLQALKTSGQPIVVPDIRALPAGDEKAFAEQWRTRSALVLPVVLAGRMLGTLQFSTETAPKNYTANEVSLARAISNHLASVIQNARLYESTERERSTLQSIIASMGEGLVVTDAGRNIIYCNKAAENLLDIECEDNIGLSEDTFREALGLRVGVEALHSSWKDALSRLDQKPKFGFEIKSGSAKRSIEATLFPIGDKSNRLGSGALFRDVTREMEIDRMKTEFISIVSHELRTPMTAVYGFAELLLLRGKTLPADQHGWVETIHKEAKRLTDIVEDLLNVSRIEGGRLSLNLGPVSVRPLLEEVMKKLLPGNPRHSIALDPQEGLPDVSADRDQLEQVIMNLLHNALKYSPAGGEVLVHARTEAPGDGVVISVTDKGIGIPEEEMPKLFGRFHRVQQPETSGIRGTGLGLYISKSLVEKMGGKIWAESRLGKGSTFYVRLNRA